jgi:hypothetical protein
MMACPPTIAIKYQIRKLMAEDEVKKAAAEAKAESADLSQMNVGLERETGHSRPLEGSPS